MKKIFYYLIIVLSSLFLILPSYAFADTYIIKKGDTPAKIAKRFKVDINKLIKINKLNPEKLQIGKEITIPKSTTLKSKIENKKTSKKVKILKNDVKITREDAIDYYTVKNGDNLYNISKRYSITVRELKELNNLNSNKLKTGQKLIVKKTSPSFYTVKKGDTLYSIAKRFNISVEDLKNINDLDSNRVKPGQRLLLEQKFAKNEIKRYEPVISTNYNVEEKTTDLYSNIELEDNNLSTKEKLILFSKKLLNLPYRFGGNSPFGIDCSAFVQKVYKFIGIDLPRSAREQYSEGIPVEKDELSVGDLVFFKTYASFPSHVGIYLGNNLFIHASSKSKKVTIDSLDTPYYFKRYIGAKRILELDSNFDKEG